eukprot:4537689-Pyramimonas_sp.AAC.1
MCIRDRCCGWLVACMRCKVVSPVAVLRCLPFWFALVVLAALLKGWVGVFTTSTTPRPRTCRDA